jgi:hypothetical protein
MSNRDALGIQCLFSLILVTTSAHVISSPWWLPTATTKDDHVLYYVHLRPRIADAATLQRLHMHGSHRRIDVRPSDPGTAAWRSVLGKGVQ